MYFPPLAKLKYYTSYFCKTRLILNYQPRNIQPCFKNSFPEKTPTFKAIVLKVFWRWTNVFETGTSAVAYGWHCLLAR
jgi:hypothetical protein